MVYLIERVIKKMFKISSLHSTVFSEYFHSLMNNNHIKSIQNGIKILMFYYVSEVIVAHIAERTAHVRGMMALLFFCLHFLVYVFTLNIQRVQTMYKLASIMSACSMVYVVTLGADTNELVEIQYSLCVIQILGMYTLLRLKFLFTMVLSVVYMLLTLSFTNSRLLQMENVIYTKLPEQPPLVESRHITHETIKRRNFLTAQFLLLVLVYLTGLYLRFFNGVRRKSAFLKLIQNAEAKIKMESAIKLQFYWIEAIMPASVKNEFLEKINKKNSFDLVYCKRFDNVSVLFADIVGFTAMSSNKTAEQIVFLLNDLYNRFDKFGDSVNCEKLGTLGDCYYCVAGCPIPRLDHANCCVDMGLAMCRLIKRFNRDNNENVNMRVGVHSGKVTAAIIGNHRFRFDVFSYDVLIANALESSGAEGKVHISEDTYNLIRHAYVAEVGEELEVKSENRHGVSGFIQKIKFIKTFFIVPSQQPRLRRDDVFIQNDSNYVKKSHSASDLIDLSTQKNSNSSNNESIFEASRRPTRVFTESEFSRRNTYLRKKGSTSIFEDSSIPQPIKTRNTLMKEIRFNEQTSDTDEMTLEENKIDFKQDFLMNINDKKIKHELELLKTLQYDHEKPVQYFKNPPLNQYTLFFSNPEIEYHYLHHTIDQVKKINIDSTKLTLLFDSIACLFYSTIMLVTITLLLDASILGKYTIIMYMTEVVVTIACIWSSLVYKSQIKFRYLRRIYRVISHPISKMVSAIYIATLPSMMIMTLDSNNFYKNIPFTYGLFTLLLFGLVGNSIYTASYSIVKHLTLIACTVGAACLVLLPSEYIPAMNLTQDTSNCTIVLLNIFKINITRLKFNFLFQFLHVSMLIYYLTRETEKNIRIYFFVSREAEIRKDEALAARTIAEGLLYNIIPRHVFAIITNNAEINTSDLNFTYAQSVPNAGIMFACINDFFNYYYREDYKSGEISLKILHGIICRFDNLLKRPNYQDLEKIKTINDCYMIASGLFETSDEDLDHLIKLLMFGFEIRRVMAKFNEDNMIGNYRFELKIGFNFGPVTAGIIGTSKPLYDIWGDAVNVASRMYSSAPIDSIQVSEHVQVLLKKHFKFRLRGKIYLKGKGNVITYLVTKPITQN